MDGAAELTSDLFAIPLFLPFLVHPHSEALIPHNEPVKNRAASKNNLQFEPWPFGGLIFIEILHNA